MYQRVASTEQVFCHQNRFFVVTCLGPLDEMNDKVEESWFRRRDSRSHHNHVESRSVLFFIQM